MAIALVSHSTAWASSNADGFTSAGMDTTGADLIVIALAQANTGTGVITDSKSNTWTQKTQQLDSGKTCEIWYAWNTGAKSGTGHTFSVTGTDTFPALCLAWFSGTQTSSDPFDVENGGHSSFASTQQTGSVTPSVDGEVIVTGIHFNANSAADTINSSFTVSDSITNTDFGHQGCAMAYQIQTTATARNPTWTNGGGSSTLCAPIATFKAAAAATAIPNKIVGVFQAVNRASTY